MFSGVQYKTDGSYETVRILCAKWIGMEKHASIKPTSRKCLLFLFLQKRNRPPKGSEWFGVAYSAAGAPTGQTFAQLPQSMQVSGSIT